MSRLFAILALVLAAGPAYASSEFLTEQQRTEALREIDSICGDTWCEGDFSFKFKSISCDSASKRCRVEFQMDGGDGETAQVDAGEQYEAFLSSGPKFDVACSIQQVSSYSDIVEGSGKFASLTDKFYTAMTECVWGLEGEIRKRMR